MIRRADDLPVPPVSAVKPISAAKREKEREEERARSERDAAARDGEPDQDAARPGRTGRVDEIA